MEEKYLYIGIYFFWVRYNFFENEKNYIRNYNVLFLF